MDRLNHIYSVERAGADWGKWVDLIEDQTKYEPLVQEVALRVCITTDKDGDRNLNFNRLLPEPSWEEENESPKADDVVALPDWYEWHCRHWGTKWNACRTCVVVEFIELKSFDTAWSPPTPMLAELGARFPSLHFEGSFDRGDVGTSRPTS